MLVAMAEARQRHEWGMASQLCATIINSVGGFKSRPAKPADFNPMREKPTVSSEDAWDAFEVAMTSDDARDVEAAVMKLS